MTFVMEQIGSEDSSGEASELMGHDEAVAMMASERYLLNELTPELRDAYEDHMFGCTECANDARFGAAFVDHAKAVLPGMVAKKAPVASKPEPVRKPEPMRKPEKEKRDWFGWLRPGIMVPVFGFLLAIIGYQNLVVYPALEASASEPRILPPAAVLYGVTRGAAPVIHADLRMGTTLTVVLPGNGSYISYKFDFYDSKSKLIWSRTIPSSQTVDDSASLWIPGRAKQDSYRLAVSGVKPTGEIITIEEQFFDLEAEK